jgi:hypothetical protein
LYLQPFAILSLYDRFLFKNLDSLYDYLLTGSYHRSNLHLSVGNHATRKRESRWLAP